MQLLLASYKTISDGSIKLIKILSLLFLLSFYSNIFSYTKLESVAAKADGYDIPITICIPDVSTNKMPVMFFVHGGGWNGGDENEVPDVHIPADCEFLCDEMGIIYVGLAYRCKGNNGTFKKALDDLNASIEWFMERAELFRADTTRIGFSGGSAGTTLSAVLAQQYQNCKVYVGSEGMYNILDQDTTLSHFPSTKARTKYGLVTPEQIIKASPYYNIGTNPAAALLFHGKDDWLCHYSQSVKYAKKLEEAGGECKFILYEGINHTCFSIAYPEILKNSIMETARLYQKGYKLNNIDFQIIESIINKRVEPYYPYKNIPGDKLIGKWESRHGVIVLNENSEGKFISSKDKKEKLLSYKNNKSWLSVSIEGENDERKFFLRKNNKAIYELILANNRWKGRRHDYYKHEN